MILSEREKLVLVTLIELFTRDAMPVSSGQIQAETDLGVSSATIRNSLHRLEEQGYLKQPHTSAGRIPTREAYRVYVEELCGPLRVPQGLSQRIRAELEDMHRGVDAVEVLTRFSRLLAGLSHNVGLSFAAQDRRDARIDRLEIVELESKRLLLVVSLDDGDVRSGIVGIERALPLEILETAAQAMNELVTGKTLAQARLRLESMSSEHPAEALWMALNMAPENRRLFADSSLESIHLEGATQIMGQPEFQDPENLRFLVRILDHPEHLGPLLLETEAGHQPSIYIGGGSAFEELRPFSLVSASCDLEGRAAYIGILGPVRMHYPLAMSLVNEVMAALRALGGKGEVA